MFRRFYKLSYITLLLACIYHTAFAAPPYDAKIPPYSRSELQLSFAPVVRKTAPAVVNIFAKRKVKQNVSPLMQDPFFRQFFGQALQNLPPRVENSLGSGVLVLANGTVITNNHVVNGADEVSVVLHDRREFPAKILRVDTRSDLAVLKIDSKEPLPFLEMADSDNLEVGDLVLAIGNPFGIGQTVTSGIISALARAQGSDSDSRYFIQTDAAINPGNSGGALVTLDNKLVGINTMIVSQSGGSVGIGFAIPSNLAKTMIEGAANGKVIRGWLGLAGQSITADLASSLRLAKPIGVIVKAVYPGSPADDVGVKPGDVVIEYGGHEVNDQAGLNFRIATQNLSSTGTIGLLRNGKKMTLNGVKLVPAPETPPRTPLLVGGLNPFAGAVIANLSPALAEELGRPEDWSGVIVLEIRGDNAASIGLQPGDIIAAIDGTEVKNAQELGNKMVESRRRWSVSIKRGDQIFPLELEMR
ncbi:MAG: Do family serine endopeptidase [Alphaproteobacteria bacterium]|nr:Do family serine endopeptidase [Alphaproteobacteria bacterium]